MSADAVLDIKERMNAGFVSVRPNLAGNPERLPTCRPRMSALRAQPNRRRYDMKIAIIGAGNVGTALGSGWSRSGHQITYAEPDEAKTKALKAAQPHARIAANAEAARQADVVVLCTPWWVTEAAIRDCGNLAGKIVIDVTNPLKPDFSGLDRGFNSSGGEQVAQWAAGAQVFKAMNQIGYKLMDHPALKDGAQVVMFVAGEGAGKPTVLQLAGELGFEVIHLG